MKEYRRICADIDLDALTHNLDEIHRCIRKETKIIAVVKADGYGHGAVPLAEVMEKREDVWGYAVATPEEAEELYTNGIKMCIRDRYDEGRVTVLTDNELVVKITECCQELGIIL